MGQDCRRSNIMAGTKTEVMKADAIYFRMKIEYMKVFYREGVYVKIPTKDRDVGFSTMIGVIVSTTDRFFVVSSLYDPNVRFSCLYKEVAITPNEYKILTEYEAFSGTDMVRRSGFTCLEQKVV